MKRKTPPGDVEWKGPDNFLSYSVMLMRRHLTKRGLEKRQEKELRWDEIPVQLQQKFREAEGKQWEEHLQFDALEPLDDAATEYVRRTSPETECYALDGRTRTKIGPGGGCKGKLSGAVSHASLERGIPIRILLRVAWLRMHRLCRDPDFFACCKCWLVGFENLIHGGCPQAISNAPS